jgi:site-specific recombinase XerD
MNEIVLANRTPDWRRLKMLVLDSVSSPITKRVYNLGLDEFFEWFAKEPRLGFTKATVSAWRVALEARGLGSISINVRITAVRKLAVEAADNGLLAPELAAGITRIKGVKSKGVRVGNWLSIRQAQTVLNNPDVSTKKGVRDRAMLAVLLGCELRRSEVAALALKHIQQQDSRWCIVDLVGKHGRVRTIPMPTWVKVAIDSWTLAAGLVAGHVLRPVNRADEAQGERMSEKVVWQLLQPYATATGVPGIAPHDLRRYAESRTMPNRFQGRSFGGELGDQSDQLIRHSQEGSEAL